jgi:hypothetical protein
VTENAVSPRLGIAYVAGSEPEGLRPAARAAEAARLDEFWLWEDCFAHRGMTTIRIWVVLVALHAKVGCAAADWAVFERSGRPRI